MNPFTSASHRRSGRSSQTPRTLTLLFCFLSVTAAITPASFAQTLPKPANCQVDPRGANDMPGQRDVTEFCVDRGDGAPFEFHTSTSLDDLRITGSNTMDSCELFDTDGDPYVNLAVCTSLRSSGKANDNITELASVRLMKCNNTRADRCMGSTLIPGPYNTFCELGHPDTDPFSPAAPNGPGGDYPYDSEIRCAIDLADFGVPSANLHMLDGCSYPSSIPGSAADDCVLYSTCLTAAACDDGNACTVDTCTPAGICMHSANEGAACSDGLFCTGEETCNSLGFCGASPTPHNCDDGIDCTVDGCDELHDTCVHDPRNSLCDDSKFCTGIETCDLVAGCVHGAPPDCSDTVNCTVDTCDAATDACKHTPLDTLCDDGAFCNGNEVCNAATGCKPGVAPNCSDGIACTEDSCDETTDSCIHAPNNAACSDGAFCDGVETCDPAAGCRPGTPLTCDDGIACTVDSCSEAVGLCLHSPSDAACSDGKFCDGVESCDPATGCHSGDIPCSGTAMCNESSDSCVGCLADADCNDGVFCNGAERCHAGVCTAGAAVSCDDGIACTVDSCNNATDSCDHTPSDALCNNGQFCDGVEHCSATAGCEAGTPTNCDDGIPCTVDSCNEAADLCLHSPNDAACSDGKFCDGVESCDPAAGCRGGGAPCTGAAMCDESSDACVACLANADCDDGVFCNGVERCVAGACAAGAAVSCDDGISCTVDTCNNATDGCDHAPSDALCDDGQFCDGVEHCSATAGCQAGPAANCNDGIACTVDSCDEAADICLHSPNDAACSDGQFCDGVESCDPAAGCRSGDIPCAGTAICDENSDSCVACLKDADCDDGVFCNGVEHCHAGTCTAGTAVSCDDGIPCTVDSCDNATASCDHAPSDALCNDGQFCDGVETCSASAGCQAGPAVNCNDGIACTVDSCSETLDECLHSPNDAACGDGKFCDGVETCDPAAGCRGGDAPCAGTAMCDEGSDSCVACLTNADCDNGVFCDGAERCLAGACTAGAAVTCDDGISCTVDSCNNATATCDHAPSDALCNDGKFCDGVETCSATAGCQAGPAVNCNDGIACTVDTCNEAANLCLHAPNDGACGDGKFCDGVESCDPATGCRSGTLPCAGAATCDETTDTCVGCSRDSDCDDGVFCNGAERCNAGTCTAGTAVSCDDGLACTVDSCDNATAQCDHTPSDALCNDGQFCNGVEYCSVATGCEAGPATNCDDGIACTVDTCNEVMDQCRHLPKDALCDDGAFCDGVETCSATDGCQDGTPVACPSDGIACSLEHCDEATASCISDMSRCVCGDHEVTGLEECDPPTRAGTYEDCNNGIDDNHDGRIDCADPTCKPGSARGPACDEFCRLDQLCEKVHNDPAVIGFQHGRGPDGLWIHGRFPLAGNPDPSVDGFTIEISNGTQPIYSASLGVGDLISNEADLNRFTFTDKDARRLGGASARDGLSKVNVTLRYDNGEAWLAFRVRAYGDFSTATERVMSTQVTVGGEVASLTEEWAAVPKRWILKQKEF